MSKDEKRELTLSSLPVEWVFLSVFGLTLFGIDLLNGRFEIQTIYFLVTGVAYAFQALKELGGDFTTWAKIRITLGVGLAAFTIVSVVALNSNML